MFLSKDVLTRAGDPEIIDTTLMKYEEIAPARPLARYIKCFWLLESAAFPSAGPERILPDGCTEIIFHLGDAFNQHKPDGAIKRQPLALLVGQMRRHILIEPTGRADVMGVRFWPGGAYPFLWFPQDEIADRIIALEDVWGGIARALQSRIHDAAAGADRVRLMESVLLSRLNRRRDDTVLNATALILSAGGRLSIDTLTQWIGIGSRRLDRTFNREVGFSPKTLCRIVRFQRAVKMLERGPNGPEWARIAIECGYYDQSHFIKEFKACSGKEPTSYFAGQKVMSDHFIGNS